MVIDTSIIIEYIRSANKPRTAFATLPGDASLIISSVTFCELMMGATNEAKKRDVNQAIAGIPILPFDEKIAPVAARIYLDLRRKNQLIEFRDIFIAATAVYHQVPLKTLNINHFSRIEGLVLA